MICWLHACLRHGQFGWLHLATHSVHTATISSCHLPNTHRTHILCTKSAAKDSTPTLGGHDYEHKMEKKKKTMPAFSECSKKKCGWENISKPFFIFFLIFFLKRQMLVAAWLWLLLSPTLKVACLQEWGFFLLGSETFWQTMWTTVIKTYVKTNIQEEGWEGGGCVSCKRFSPN